MEDSRQPPTDDGVSFTLPGTPREEVLRRRWGMFFVTRKTPRQIYELLKERGEMSKTAIAEALGKSKPYIHQEARNLKRVEIIDVVRRSRQTYYRLRPGMVEQYEAWLASQQSDKPEP